MVLFLSKSDRLRTKLPRKRRIWHRMSMRGVRSRTWRGLNNSAYAILLFVSLSVLILRCICIILCKNALVIILLSRLITRIISPWIIWKWYVCIIAYLTSNYNTFFKIHTQYLQKACKPLAIWGTIYYNINTHNENTACRKLVAVWVSTIS